MKRILLLCMGLLAGCGLMAQPRLVGHRGAGLDAPENTLAALRAGLASGMDALEVDVHLTADSVVVLSHDETLDRCTDGHGRIDAHAWADLRRLDAGGWHGPAHAGERMPTLDEALSLVDGQAVLFIEIKGTGRDYQGLERRVVEAVQAHRAHGWVEVISFNTEALRRVHALDSSIRLQQLLVSTLRGLPWYLGKKLHWGSPKRLDFVQGISLYHRCLGKGLVRRIHGWGMAANAWTLVSARGMRRMARIGVDAVTTDRPSLLRQVLGAAAGE